MKFSIIVPVYNTEKYLGECLDSLINQTYRDFEVILIDDGSTDGSPKICDMYAEKYPDKIKLIHQQNSRQIRTRLNGIAYSVGEYCLFCDSDDVVCGELLATVDRKIKEYSEPDIIIYSFKYLKNNGVLTNRKKSICNCDRIFEGDDKCELYGHFISDSLISSMCTKAVKRELLISDRTDYSDVYDLSVGEDLYESAVIASLAHKILYINDALYYYRFNLSSVSRSISYENIDKNNSLRVYHKFKQFLGVWNMDTDEWRMRLDANWLAQGAYNFCRFYTGAADAKARQTVIEYDWSSFVDNDSLNNLNMNSRLSPAYKKLWKYILKKDRVGLFLYFAKKKAYEVLKIVKKSLKKK